MQNRRSFLKATGTLASGLLIGRSAFSMDDFASKGSIKKFGLQLYSLRTDLPNDPKGVLKQVASFGYKQIESYEGKQGMFWGMSNKEFKKYMDELGMTIVSSHCNINNDFETKAAQAGEIGMKYLICPSLGGANKSLDDFKRAAEKFNACGEICKKNGLKFAYHNHGYSFETMEGQLPQDILMQNTNKDTVDFEMDIYWVVTAGADPIAWLDKYPGRWKLCHVKDRKKDAAAGDHDASIDLGVGNIDFKKILKASTSKGMEYFIVEQERYDNSTPLKSAAADAAYMKKLKL
ncbi:sugar phosphate isomerase/epimerase family protein [Niastella populi]|uniref:Sugar phosphate isomerase n=1 Tax=Niastella populi TaxID=550983 RepID=A0A1V9EHN2_9BACT|nr:sugar phosphate isomerase/epimerase [Niastella populi]OQP45648.1 sugar phosphate isomerase [Niastella populi]